jgi:PAS domain S-box-containing protein
MSEYRLSDLLDVSIIQRMADAHYLATGMPVGIVDAIDGSVVVVAGWQDACLHFHRANPETLARCRESDAYINSHLVEGAACRYKCRNGMWDIAMPIVVNGRHLASLFLGQFLDEDEVLDWDRFREQAREFGFDTNEYLAALGRVPVFKRQTVDQIVEYDKALARFIADIAEHALSRRQAEEDLRAQSEFLRVLLDAMPYAIFYKDRQGRYLGCNRGFEAFYGMSRDQITGKTTYDVAPKDLADIYTATDHALFANPGTQVYETLMQSADGVRHEVIFHKATFNDPDGRVAGIVGAVVDVTERNRIEREKNKLREQLSVAQKLESVGRLAGGVAHDLNNMLSVITGYTELALDRLDSTDALRADLEEIRVAAERSRNVTRQLLAFARRQVVEPRPLYLNVAIDATVKMLQRLIGENVELTWRPGGAGWSVLMDPSQLDQVLANLCVNARDAIGDVGHVIIETGTATLDEAASAEVEGLAPGDFAWLSVTDDGCGMDAETMGKIFEPFYTTKGTGRGTGLGLATVYGVARQNNGGVKVASKPGAGSTFTVYFPRCEVATVETAAAAAIQAPRGRGETVLVVEDEPAILKMAERVLRDHNYDVLKAENPTEAIRLVGEHGSRIRLVLTDVVMPEMNGRQLAEAVSRQCASIRCIYMSGYTADVIAQKGVLDKGCHFIQKPFTPADLASAVRTELDAA